MSAASKSNLSAFGQLLTRLADREEVTKKALAEAAGIRSTSVMTECLLEKSASRKAYGPPAEALIPWADRLGLKGKERRHFILMGLAQRSPAVMDALMTELE
jgi:hypothetical protein